MLVTISKDGEWHRKVPVSYAREVMNRDAWYKVSTWQIKAAVYDQHRLLHGWRIKGESTDE